MVALVNKAVIFFWGGGGGFFRSSELNFVVAFLRFNYFYDSLLVL